MYLHGVQMALLQHSSLYESIASSLHRAQKNDFGKALLGKELSRSAHNPFAQLRSNIQRKILQLAGERRRFGVGSHGEVVCELQAATGYSGHVPRLGFCGCNYSIWAQGKARIGTANESPGAIPMGARLQLSQPRRQYAEQMSRTEI